MPHLDIYKPIPIVPGPFLITGGVQKVGSACVSAPSLDLLEEEIFFIYLLEKAGWSI